MSIDDSQTAGAEQVTGPSVTPGDAPSPASPPDVIVPDAPDHVAVLEGHLHELEVKLNERDAEILSLRAKLEALTAVTSEVTCSTCGTRNEVTHA